MNLIHFTTIIAVASAAQLPSNSYLPQNQGSPPRPSNSYLPQNQGSPQRPAHFDLPNSHGSQGGYQQGGQGGYQGSFAQGGGSGGNGNTRPQQEIEKNAAILKQDQEVNENGFHYSYETSNGIRAEEAGDASQSQGGFSYKGDDGNTYSIIFTAGEGGFRPQGDHIPVPPPTPEAILQALDQNAKDEAAGIFDDGQYRPDSNGKGINGNGGFSGGQNFGSSNHQGNFNSGSGYRY